MHADPSVSACPQQSTVLRPAQPVGKGAQADGESVASVLLRHPERDRIEQKGRRGRGSLLGAFQRLCADINVLVLAIRGTVGIRCISNVKSRLFRRLDVILVGVAGQREEHPVVLRPYREGELWILQ